MLDVARADPARESGLPLGTIIDYNYYGTFRTSIYEILT